MVAFIDLPTSGVTAWKLLRIGHAVFGLPVLVLNAIDASRYYHGAADKYFPVIILTFVFFSLSLFYGLFASLLLLNQPTIRLGIFIAADMFMFAALLSMGNTTLSMRAAWNRCDQYVNGCTDDGYYYNLARAQGALAIVAAICCQGCYIVPLHCCKGKWCWFRRRTEERAPEVSA